MPAPENKILIGFDIKLEWFSKNIKEKSMTTTYKTVIDSVQIAYISEIETI